MKRYLFLMIIAFFPFTMQAQQVTENDLQSQFAEGSLYTGAGLPSPFSPLRFNVETGMRFGTFGHGNFLQTFVNPAFSMPLNKKLTISAGISYSNTQLNNTPLISNTGEIRQHSGKINTLTIHTSGLYRVNDKLTVSGAVYKTVNPALNSRLNSNAINMEAQGVAFGLGYQLNESLYIGASVKMQQGNSNYYDRYSSPFRNSFSNDPFVPLNTFGAPGGF
jgi:long-subunit fatty acid transport protein